MCGIFYLKQLIDDNLKKKKRSWLIFCGLTDQCIDMEACDYRPADVIGVTAIL